MDLKKQTLKMSLQEIRNAIDLNKTNWVHNGDTNCYAYALGLDIAECDIIEYAYVPGVMSGSSVRLYEDPPFQCTDFINNLYNDLNFLGIDFREVKPNEIILPNEWKIAIYTTPCRNGCMDFHFLRLCGDGMWHHKNGYNFRPTVYDDDDKIITNIEDCYLELKKYEKCLSLKLR